MSFCKSWAAMLTVVVCLNSLGWSQATPIDSHTRDESQEQVRVAHIRTDLHKYDKTKSLKVKLRTGEELKGRVESLDEDSFTLRAKDGTVRTLNYGDVKQVRKAGLSTAVKIAIIAGVGVAVVAIVFAIGLKTTGPLFPQ